ncbi:MAG TPA: hypothetical protein VHB97_21205, partial [Polyangia bacterium]|nr:hypothetical protein [Polyangia bacterium]
HVAGVGGAGAGGESGDHDGDEAAHLRGLLSTRRTADAIFLRRLSFRGDFVAARETDVHERTAD